MEHQTYDAGICVMTRIFHLIGGKWKPVILHLIRQDINRFGLLKKSMPKISKKILTEQLRELEQDELISRCVINSDYPQVVVYHLTTKGLSVRNLIDGMIAWGLEYFGKDYPPALLQEFKNRPSVLEKEALISP